MYTKKLVGISLRKSGKYSVRVTVSGVRHHLGVFDTLEVAAKSRDLFLTKNGVNQKQEIVLEDTDKECWKNLSHPFQNYFISSLGRVVSNQNGTSILVIQSRTKQGYHIVKLSSKDKIVSRTVHLLVAELFLNHKSDGTHKKVVDHIDRDKSNNAVNNLQVIAHRENVTKDMKISNSGVRGVTKTRCNTFLARISLCGKVKYLGSYKTIEEASEAYNNELLKIKTDE